MIGNKSNTIGELAGALAKAQGAYGRATKQSDNPYFKSKYADLATVLEAIRQPLSDNGLAFVQLVYPNPASAVVESALMHSSGEWISATIELTPARVDPQGMGSAITYARRYGASALLGIAQEDDDGEKAMGRKSMEMKSCEPKHVEEPKGIEETIATAPLASLKSMCNTQTRILKWDTRTAKEFRQGLFPNVNQTDMTIEQWRELANALLANTSEMAGNKCGGCGVSGEELSEHNGKKLCMDCFIAATSEVQ